MCATWVRSLVILFAGLGAGLFGCSSKDNRGGKEVVWLTEDVPGETRVTPADQRGEDLGGEVSWVGDALQDETGSNGDVTLDLGGESVCVPECDGKECGPDGCGGLCGDCQAPNKCDKYSKCVYKSPDCAYCVDPYPACVQINGVWSCVGCEDDSDCPDGIVCDAAMYACMGQPPVEIPKCDAETPCEESDVMELDLACELGSGLCYDRFGWCDGLHARCRPSSWCITGIEGLSPVLGEIPDIYPPGAEPGTVGLCACQNPADATTLMPCLLDNSQPCPPSPECPGMLVCVATPVAISMCPHPSSAPGVCVDLNKIMDSK